jgi:hypothetical protein
MRLFKEDFTFLGDLLEPPFFPIVDKYFLTSLFILILYPNPFSKAIYTCG